MATFKRRRRFSSKRRGFKNSRKSRKNRKFNSYRIARGGLRL